MDDLLGTFEGLFAGRRDVWGAVHGEAKVERITDDHWRQHLWGQGSLGIYPMATLDQGDTWQVRWGCTDIDKGYELIPLARNMQRALQALGITSWIEKTKGKGYHVWVFAQEWVPAETMRNALLVAHAVAGVKPQEVNPKQVTLEGLKGYGNYVNLPYAKRWVDLFSTRVVLDPDTGLPMRLADFVFQADRSRTPTSVLSAAAALYVPPSPRATVVVEHDGSLDAAVVRRLNGLAHTIFQKGPLEGRDRSGTLTRLAHLCRESGLTASEAFAVCWDADGRWGKYHDRRNGLEEMQRLVGGAYAKAAP